MMKKKHDHVLHFLRYEFFWVFFVAFLDIGRTKMLSLHSSSAYTARIKCGLFSLVHKQTLDCLDHTPVFILCAAWEIHHLNCQLVVSRCNKTVFSVIFCLTE